MPKLEYSFELTNDLSELDRLCQCCEEVGDSIGMTKKAVFEMNLSLEELFTNIISYGFKDGKEHLIKIRLVVENDIMSVRIEDDGIPFNPMDAEEPDLTCSLEECKIGGLGIHLIKKIMDEIQYKRDGDLNILLLKKQIAE
jgi:serine/threonine-protein kinase RsbW